MDVVDDTGIDPAEDFDRMAAASVQARPLGSELMLRGSYCVFAVEYRHLNSLT